jgi:RNA polymerase sigma-70 factor (ECF subfamily)
VALGDRAAFQLLYTRWAGRLLAYVGAMGAQGPAGEDLVQEIFLTLWQKAGQYRRELGSPEAWIFTLTRHKVVDIWRRQHPVEVVDGADLEGWMAGGVDAHGPVEDGLSVTQALARLPQDHRRALLLAYYGDLSYEATAQRLGLPVGTLKSRIRSALAQLRGMLGGAP